MEHDLLVMATPLCMALLDVVTGYASAARNGRLNSTVMRDGLWNKLAEMFAIVAAKSFEFCITLFGTEELGVKPMIPVTLGVCAYLTLYELTSIVENIGKMSPAIGRKLVEVFGIEPSKVGIGGGDDGSAGA